MLYSKALSRRFLDSLEKDLKEEFSGAGEIAVKLHFGEPGNKTALTPEVIQPFIDIINRLGIRYFLYDSSVAYGGMRSSPKTHKEAAERKGFTNVRTDDDPFPVKGKWMTYEVAKPLVDADGVLVITHFKGHICSGFGGNVKNLGMGALTKKTKSDIHDYGKPSFKGECIRCKACERSCPLNTLKVADQPVFGTCFGCSACSYVCPKGSIRVRAPFDETLAEGAAIAQSRFKRHYYITILRNITKQCDCLRDSGDVIAKDQGFLAGKDGVAIDRRARDIIVEAEGKDIFLLANKKTGLLHLEAAERFGMGKNFYTSSAL